MKNRLFSLLISGILLVVFSCNETGNEPNKSTNTHNTSQSSPASNTENIQVDARSRIPASRLNDGNLDTRSSNRGNLPETSNTVETTGASTNTNGDQSVDVDENQQGQVGDTTSITPVETEEEVTD